MDITPIRRGYTSFRSSVTSTVSGPLAFIKLALEDLRVPFLYFKRSLRVGAGSGASFQVYHFDITDDDRIKSLLAASRGDYFPLEVPDLDRRDNVPRGEPLQLLPTNFKKGQWLISKHISPLSINDRELMILGELPDSHRLAAMTLEMRILAHEPIQHHPNIVTLLAFTWEKEPDEFDRRWPILLMEDGDCGTLANLAELKVSPLTDLRTSISIAADIASGLSALHSCGVVHGDLKYQNILIFEQPNGTYMAKVSDFGMASVIPDLKASGVDSTTDIQLPGFTRPWEAPEVYRAVSLQGLPKIDVFAFGLLFCGLVTKGKDIFEPYHITEGTEANEQEINYDYDAIFELKTGGTSMIDYAHNCIILNREASEADIRFLCHVVDATLHTDPALRGSMKDITALINGLKDPLSEAEASLPLLFNGEPVLNEIPEQIYHWHVELKLAAARDIIIDLSTRSRSDINSADSTMVAQGSERLFWLSKWALSGDIGAVPLETCLDWLLEAADYGNIQARSTVFNIHSALGRPFPAERMISLKEWLVDACLKDENPAQGTLMELFPELVPQCLETLRTVYCGYGQDCFGEDWRVEFPLDSSDAFTQSVLQYGSNINELHEYPGLVCGMTWLHYASSYGRADIVRSLVEQGSDPNLQNDYGETALFMACQAGHYEVATFLLSLTENTKHDESRNTELHSLDRFEEGKMEHIAQKLLDWGADINARDDDLGLTPLGAILNRNGIHCMEAVRVLLKNGADPLLKDAKRIDCVAHAAANFSITQVTTILQYIPVEQHIDVKADTLWFLLELERSEALIRGGQHMICNLRDIIILLIDDEVCTCFESKTYHSVLSFACASATVEVVSVLLELLPNAGLNEFRPSSWTPLVAAIVQNRPELVELLLEAGADATAKPVEDNWTSLFYAAVRMPRIVSALVESVVSRRSYDAAVEYVNYRDKARATAFDIAVTGEFYESANILSRFRPDFLAFEYPYDETESCFMNLLGHVCYIASAVKYILGLLDDPLKGFIIDSKGVSLLHAAVGVSIDRASEEEAEKILDIVLERFSNPEYANHRTQEGNAPLHYAARFGNVMALRKLEETFGASIDWHATNELGLTALHEAELRPFHDVSELGRLAKARYATRTKATIDFLVGKGVGRSSPS